jgi:EAL domain-containing protein (putative c-di-GMP-specific phosphodiesterase class I)
MEGLKKINCKVAISNFSNGPSSDSLLEHLPIDIVKLSPEFMTNLANDTKRQDALQEINRQLQDDGLTTIASGVEDANSLAVLWNVGVNYIQGYFLQEPSRTIALTAE